MPCCLMPASHYQNQCWHIICKHDDVIKWKHFPRYWPFVRGIHRSPVNSPHKGQWRGALMFSLICVGLKGWINNHEAGDLRPYRVHYDVTLMGPVTSTWEQFHKRYLTHQSLALACKLFTKFSFKTPWGQCVNIQIGGPIDTCMCQYNWMCQYSWSSLNPIMACRLFSAKSYYLNQRWLGIDCAPVRTNVCEI